jgi:type II secretory pathway component GspD/PulD (secretin)
MFCLLLVIPAQAREVFLNPSQGAASAASTQTSLAAVKYPMQIFQLKYLRAKEMVGTVKGLLAEGESVTLNEVINTLIVRADQKTIDRLVKIIDKLDTPPLQVQVEAKIIEVKSGSGDTSKSSVVGANWKIKKTGDANDYVQQLTTDTLTTGATSLGLYAQLLSGNVDAYLSALEKSLGYDLVASPWITALNHKQAEILIGSKYGYKQTIVTQTAAVQEVKFLEVGTKLKFIPHIVEDGYIVMEIYPSVSEGQVVDGLPSENTTETKNEVLVKDSQTIVIGGLTKKYNNQVEIGVPILSHIPILGNLFRRTELVSEKREIMVLITPHIVTPEFLKQMAERAKGFEAEQKQKNIEHSKLIH